MQGRLDMVPRKLVRLSLMSVDEHELCSVYIDGMTDRFGNCTVLNMSLNMILCVSLHSRT